MSTQVSRRGQEVLAHLAAGRPADFGLRGRSEYGGLSRTLAALRRAGLLTPDERITDAGRSALATLTPEPAHE